MNFPLPAPHARRRTVVIAAVSVLAAGSLAACTGNDDTADGNGDGELDQVTYMTSFGQLGRDSYVYMAQELGYFEEAGIEVTVEPGQGTNPVLQAVVGGQADFGVADISAAILSKDQGVENFTTIAAIHQLPPVALMATDPDIQSPVDMEGRSVSVTAGGVDEYLIPTYLELAGADPSEVELNPISPAELVPALASGNTDAIGQFVMGEPLVEGAVGGDVQVMPYSDYLTDLYGIGLMTTSEIAENDPDLAGRFRDALLRGLEYSLDNPQEAAEALAAVAPATNTEVAARELEIMRAFSEPPVGPLGTLDADKLARSIALLQASGALSGDSTITPEDMVDFDLIPSAENAE